MPSVDRPFVPKTGFDISFTGVDVSITSVDISITGVDISITGVDVPIIIVDVPVVRRCLYLMGVVQGVGLLLSRDIPRLCSISQLGRQRNAHVILFVLRHHCKQKWRVLPCVCFKLYSGA